MAASLPLVYTFTLHAGESQAEEATKSMGATLLN